MFETQQDHAAPMHWQQDLMNQLAKVHAEMKALSGKTRSVPGQPCYLQTYTRKGYGVTLRWRAATHAHITAEVAQRMINQLAPTMRHWFRRAGYEAERLNREERALRAQLRTLQTNKAAARMDRLL